MWDLDFDLLVSEPQTYSVEEAVETIGFGRFHVLLFIIMGSASVSVCVCV